MQCSILKSSIVEVRDGFLSGTFICECHNCNAFRSAVLISTKLHAVDWAGTRHQLPECSLVDTRVEAADENRAGIGHRTNGRRGQETARSRPFPWRGSFKWIGVVGLN
jgi:hypothetical protein